ncbi:hypothetical protein RI367_007962 [Sorochytrium milnesiophthora]
MSNSNGGCHVQGAVGLPLQANATCAPHFYCPNSTDIHSLPTYCPPSIDCSVRRLWGETCPPQGVLEPIVCPSKYYCPDQYTMIQCPAGYYCPVGSITPRQCPSMSNCPAGTRTPTYFGGIVICAVLDVLLVVTVLLLRRWDANRAATGQFQNLTAPTEPADGDVETGQPNIESSSPLFRAFKRAMGDRNLQMNFRFEQLGLRLTKEKSILAGVTGTIRSGRLTAIMGPSGAGKTTFMNVLMGKVQRTEGKLYIDGRETEMHHFKKIIGYVPQEDVMLRELTVRENILHAARIKLPADWTSRDINDYADAVVASLRLSHVAHTQVGDETQRGVSGGQRKRVNIGTELAGVPLTLFLDEPTSGLDSTSALMVCSTLKDISRLGLTIVSVIHQPRYEIFCAFDDMILLVPGGKTAYIGPTAEAQAYFESLGYEFDPRANPADLLMDILAGSGVNKRGNRTTEGLVSAWESHVKARPPSSPSTVQSSSEADETFHKQVPAMSKQRGAFWYWQIWHCHNRSVRQQFRAISSLWLELAVAVIAGALMGISINGADFFSGMYIQPYTLMSPAPNMWLLPLSALLIGLIIALAGAPAGVKVFSEERTVYWREAASGHNVLSYYIGKTIGSVYRFTLSAFHFASIFAFLAQPQSSFERQFSVILLEFFGVYGLSAMVSMVVQRQNASMMAVISGLFAAIFCGFGPNLKQASDWGIIFIWVAFLTNASRYAWTHHDEQEMSFNKWGAEALYGEALALYDGVYDIQTASSGYGYTLYRYWTDIGMMVIIGCVFRVIAFLLMVFTHRDRQR